MTVTVGSLVPKTLKLTCDRTRKMGNMFVGGSSLRVFSVIGRVCPIRIIADHRHPCSPSFPGSWYLPPSRHQVEQSIDRDFKTKGVREGRSQAVHWKVAAPHCTKMNPLTDECRQRCVVAAMPSADAVSIVLQSATPLGQSGKLR